MSWRMHLAIVDSATIAQIRNDQKEKYLNAQGFTCDEDGENATNEFYLFVKDFGCKEDYCIGSLPLNIRTIGMPFYTNPETQELFDHYSPRVLDINQFNLIIELMRREAYALYDEAEKGGPDAWHALIHKRKQLWDAEYITPYNLRQNSKELVNAFSIDYQIWDLVRMYKTIDWEKDALILFGW